MRAFSVEAPIHSYHIPVALILPSIDLAAQDVLIGNPSVQALSSQHSDLYLRHIQPTPVFGCVHVSPTAQLYASPQKARMHV